MSKKRKRNSIIYGVFLTIYILALASAIIYGLSKVWAYAVEYENAVPEKVVDQYVADLSENLWDDSIADTISEMPHEMQSDEECAAIVQDMLKNDISYVRMPKASGSDPTIRYKLRCGENDFGIVTLIEDESKKNEIEYGMLPWKVHKEEFDFTGLYSSVEITVPASYSVKLNDNRLGEEYIVEEGIHYDVLDGFYERYPNLPTKVKYKFDNVIGHLTPVVYDENGEETVIDPEKDDSQYLSQVDDEHLSRFTEFTNEFIVRYKEYISGQYDPAYGYNRLLPNMKKGSELDESMLLAQDGLGWAHAPQMQINSITLNGAIYAGDGTYFLDVTSDITTTKNETTTQRVENMRIIVAETGNEIRAVAIDIY